MVSSCSLTVFNFTGTHFCQAEKPAQEPLLEALNGRKINLLCSHPNIKTNEYIYWYQQFSNQPPHLIASGFQGTLETNEGERVSLIIPKERKNSTLSFTKVTSEDQALYLCGVGDTVSHPSDSVWQEPFLAIQLPPETEERKTGVKTDL